MSEAEVDVRPPAAKPARLDAARAQASLGEGHDAGDRPRSDNQASTKITYSQSAGLFARLARLNIALAFTSYHSGYLYMLGSSPEHGPQLHQSATPKPMGISADEDGGLTLACGGSIIRYRNVLNAREKIDDVFDACFMPRTMHMTGELDAHDVGIDSDGRVVFVNTRFNCLATVSQTHSFDELWRPSFISALIDEDRCHLNGLAMEDGRPAFVTAVSRSDTVDGWRDRRVDGEVVIDVRANEVVCSGLSMPHSPRLHRGELWVLNAGAGELEQIPITTHRTRQRRSSWRTRAA